MKFRQREWHWVVMAWALFLILFYSLGSYLAASELYGNRMLTTRLHMERVNPHTTEQNRTQVNYSQLAPAAPNVQRVKVGIYVDRIVKMSTKSHDWTVDFYLWFRWHNNNIDPGKDFQVVNGDIVSKTRAKSEDIDGTHYALYRVTAYITKFFNVVRYPLDNHLLTIRIEDRRHTWEHLQYVPDVDGAAYSSRVQIPGYRLSKAKLVTKLHAYKTSRGDPRLRRDHQAVYSQLTYAIAIQRPNWGLYIKAFQGLFASVAIAFLAFAFGPSSGERISLGVGAFFAAVASGYLNLSRLPGVGVVTMVDIVNGMGMVTIFLTLLGSVVSAAVAKREGEMVKAELLDRVSLVLFVVGFVAFNIAAAVAAAP